MARAALPADHFDGRSARARRVELRIADGQLWVDQVDGQALALRLPLDQVQWPERTCHGKRVAHLAGGGMLQALDAAAWDAWAREAGIAESAVVAAQQSWRAALAALLLLVALAAVGYGWGLPWLARATLAALPPSVDRVVGEAVLRSFDEVLLLPSTVPPARQEAVRAAFAQAAERADPDGERPAYELHFRTSRPQGAGGGTRAGRDPDRQPQLGANAFALPGGSIIVTDEMLQLLKGRDEVLIGVLGHELGHVRRRHGMRMLVQATLLGGAASLAWGDISAVLAAAPVLLGQNAYSRDFEREADDDAVRLLRASGMSPLVMVELFERLADHAIEPPGRADGERTGGEGRRFDLGIALAGHPADAERVQRFRDAARR